MSELLTDEEIEALKTKDLERLVLEGQLKAQMNILKRRPADLTDTAKHFLDAEGLLRVNPELQVVALMDPNTGQIPDTVPEYRRSTSASDAAAVATAATVGITETQVEVVAIKAELDTDVNVANRVFSLTGSYGAGLPGAVGNVFSITAITIPASQYGILFLPSSPLVHWTNTNGVIATVADENPLPLVMNADSAITADYTNKQAGDLAHLEVWYKVMLD